VALSLVVFFLIVGCSHITLFNLCSAAYFELSPTRNRYTHNGRHCEGFEDNSSQ
jgi:hypothetical protein